MAECVEDAFRYGKTVLATTTYNADIFPFMKEFINHLSERGFRNKTVGLIENGSWAPLAAKTMKSMLESCKDITYTDTMVKIMSALNDESTAQLDALAEELTKEHVAQNGETANKNDLTSLFNIGNGLHEDTSNDGKKGYVCKVCGYVYEGEDLPDGFVCPLCKHGAADFEPIK